MLSTVSHKNIKLTLRRHVINKYVHIVSKYYSPGAEPYPLWPDTIEDLKSWGPVGDDVGSLQGKQLSDEQQGSDENPSCELHELV